MSRSNIHSIKLKGPWMIVRAPCDSRTTEQGATATIPFEWRALFGASSGSAVLERRFNRPTGLTSSHRVRIVFRDAAGLQRVAVNDAPLLIEVRAEGVQYVDITRHLAPHNRLTIEIKSDPGPTTQAGAGIWQPVVLEIEEPQDSTP